VFSIQQIRDDMRHTLVGDGDTIVVPFPVLGGAVVAGPAELALFVVSVRAALEEEVEPDVAAAVDDWETTAVEEDGATTVDDWGATVEDWEAPASPEGDGVALSPQAEAAPLTPLP
jgi:hypothetical protein